MTRILLTGDAGYLGAVMAPLLREAGHEVQGLDALLYAGCELDRGGTAGWIDRRPHDIRDLEPAQLEGFDAVLHLAALSNDPLGSLNPSLTEEINHQASVHLAECAKRAGVRRFLFASSCSLYGVAGDDLLDEDAAFNPVTAYGRSKVLVERDLASLADERFSPVSLRNATAYGASSALRLDLVVNEFVALAVTTGEIEIRSDGTPWRPLVHAEDIARAFLGALEAPREVIHDRAFNVGRTDENYQVSEIADLVAEAVPGSRVVYAPGGGPDPRCYRVDCGRLAAALPDFAPRWTLERGIAQLRDAFQAAGLTEADVTGPRFRRIGRIRQLMAAGSLDHDLRWITPGVSTPGHHAPLEGCS